MEKPSSSPSLNTGSDPKFQIEQNVEGDRNQTIGQVLGGMVVYGTVIYNNPPAEPDSSTAQTKDPQVGANPYKGLLAFQETDGDRFFGRDLQIKELWEKFRNLHEKESATRLLTIYGPSGSGKSSLARAGLIPELARQPLPGGDLARVAVLVPGSHPLESLATVLARITTNDPTPVAKTREFATELAQANAEGVYDGLRRIADALPEIAISPLIVMVDQLEEVFTLCEDPKERDAFIGNLLCAVADRAKRVSAIFTLRSDFLGATQKHPLLNQAIAAQGYLVAAMSEDGLREAIAKPAELAGHPLDLSTINLLIEQTADRDGALPLLQFALTRIWAGLEEGKEPAETLRVIGGVGGALAGEAQRIYESLTPDDQEIARRVFLGLVQLGEGAKDTRRRTDLDRVVSYRDSLEQVQRVISRFASPSARLITLANNEGEETAEVTHEALFDNWQQLKDWLNGGRSDLRFQRRLDDAVMVWQENGQPEGNLWRSPDLDLLHRYQVRAGNDMTPLQMNFFQASEGLETKRKNITQLVRGGIFTAFFVITGFASFTIYLLKQAQRQHVEQLVVNAQALLAGNQTVKATIYAIAATRASQSGWLQFLDNSQIGSVDGSLLDAIRENHEQNQLFHDDKVRSVAYSPDGLHIISASDDKTIRIWDAKTGKVIGNSLLGHTADVSSVSYSQDGQRIISGSKDKTIRIWDVKTGKSIGQPLLGHTAEVNSASYSPDSQHIVSASNDKTIRIWDANTGKPIGEPLKGHQNEVWSASYSPDGQSIVSGSKDKMVRIWNAKTGKPIGEPLLGHTAEVNSVSYSPDSQHIVSGSDDKTLRIWDAKTGQPIGEPLRGHQKGVWSVSYSPDGRSIVSGSRDRTVQVWDAKTGKPIGEPLRGHESGVNSVVFSLDSQNIVSGSWDRTVRIWDINPIIPIYKLLQGHEKEVWSVSYSPDSTRIISGSEDKTVRIWDATTGVSIGQPLLGHKSGVRSVSYSPDGKRIISGSNDTTVQIWDATTGAPIGKPLLGHKGAVSSVSYSPDGKRIISGSNDTTVQIWDAITEEPINKPLIGHTAEVISVSYSQDGKRIVSGGSDKTVRIWDAKTGKPIGQPLLGHTDRVNSVSYSRDGKYIVSGSNDKTVRIWGENMKITKLLRGHRQNVESVAFSSDSKRIISGSVDNEVRVWDASTGLPIGKPLIGHENSVNSVAISADSQRLVSGNSDKTLRIWDVSWKYLLPIACNRLRYHPSLNQRTIDVANEAAKQTCEQYVWKK